MMQRSSLEAHVRDGLIENADASIFAGTVTFAHVNIYIYIIM